MRHNPEFDAYAVEAVNLGHIDNILSLDTFRPLKIPEADYIPKEFTDYTGWESRLRGWSDTGYPPERLAEDLRRWAARF